MRVGVKNNSLVEAIKVLGAQRAGLLMADLVSNLPSVIFGKPLDEFGISISYNIGQILIKIDVIYPETIITPAYFVSLYSLDFGIKPSVVSVLESKGIILGLIYLVLNIMPVQESSPFIFKGVKEATAAGYLFEWKDSPNTSPDPWTQKYTFLQSNYPIGNNNIYYSVKTDPGGPTSMIDTVKSDMELNAAMDSIIWKILPDFIDTLKPPTAISTVDSKSEYEEGTLHRRRLDI